MALALGDGESAVQALACVDIANDGPTHLLALVLAQRLAVARAQGRAVVAGQRHVEALQQIDRALDVLDRMQPMNTQNEFWTRHELPYDLEPLEAKSTG